MTCSDPRLRSDQVLRVAKEALGEQQSLETPFEAVALIGHACMIAIGFRLLGLGERHNIRMSSSIHMWHKALTSLESPTNAPTLPAQWNAGSSFDFRYAHDKSSMQYLVKIGQLGNNSVTNALALGDDSASSFDLPVKDYISGSALPISSTDSLGEVFISPSRLQDLISLFKINVIEKLAPGLSKASDESSGRDALIGIRAERRPDPFPFSRNPNPLAILHPRRPQPAGDFAPPGFEDEFEINRPPRAYPPGMGGRSPYNIGDRDLYPAGLGPNDPLRGTIGPGFGSGGMHPTFDDPLFGGPGAGGGYDPRAPPGARYDPPGPGGPPFGRGRGPFGGPGGGFGGFDGGDII